MKFIDEDVMRNKSGIYKIANTANGKVYIGKTTRRFIERYWNHRNALSNDNHFNVHLQCAWNKYGESAFEFSVVEVVSSENENEMNELEMRYIKMMRDIGKCYNISDGGDGVRGVPVTDERKRKIGERNREANLGRKHSEETKMKMSKLRKGRHLNEDCYKLTEEQAFEIKTRLVGGEKPSNISEELGIDYKYINNIVSSNAWYHVEVDGWDEFRANRRTWTRLTPEDHREIYRLHVEEGYTKYELAEMYHKGHKMIERIFRDCRNLEKNENERNENNHMTIQCQAS